MAQSLQTSKWRNCYAPPRLLMPLHAYLLPPAGEPRGCPETGQAEPDSYAAHFRRRHASWVAKSPPTGVDGQARVGPAPFGAASPLVAQATMRAARRPVTGGSARGQPARVVLPSSFCYK